MSTKDVERNEQVQAHDLGADDPGGQHREKCDLPILSPKRLIVSYSQEDRDCSSDSYGSTKMRHAMKDSTEQSVRGAMRVGKEVKRPDNEQCECRHRGRISQR